MSAPRLREFTEAVAAPVPVRRQKSSLLRRHWLTGAFVCGLLAISGYTAQQFVVAQAKLQHVRETRAEMESRLQEARFEREALAGEFQRVTSDGYMLLKAKELGFIFPHEKAFQRGPSPGP